MQAKNISELLLETALKSYIQHQIACIIVHHNKIVSIGYNRGLKHSSCNHQCLL